MTARNNQTRQALLALLLLLPGLAAAADSADTWLVRMNHALHKLNYEGRFVYLHGDILEAMYLSHSVVNGHERERLMSLTGVAREVIRDEKSVLCIVSGQAPNQVEKWRTQRYLAPVQAIRPDKLSAYYRFEMGGQQRVAGRSAQAISILPKDNLRYGYRLLLEQNDALPLATATLDHDGRRISQLLFTELRVGPVKGGAIHSLEQGAEVIRQEHPRDIPESQPQPLWRFDDLPNGFVQTRYRHRLIGRDEQQVEHFIFSDGLATVSVYVEADHQPDAVAGLSRLGAMTALRRTLPGYQVTAVGEVPEQTLRRFLDGIYAEASAP